MKTYALGILAAVLLGVVTTYTVLSWKHERDINALNLEHANLVAKQLMDNLAMSTNYRQLERDLATALTKVSAYYQGRIQDVDDDKNRFIADVRNGTIKLRDPYRPTGKAGGGITTKALGGSSGRDGETGCELSREASEFLYSEASRADKVVEQLTACQGVVGKYLQYLGG